MTLPRLRRALARAWAKAGKRTTRYDGLAEPLLRHSILRLPNLENGVHEAMQREQLQECQAWRSADG